MMAMMIIDDDDDEDNDDDGHHDDGDTGSKRSSLPRHRCRTRFGGFVTALVSYDNDGT